MKLMLLQHTLDLNQIHKLKGYFNNLITRVVLFSQEMHEMQSAYTDAHCGSC